MIRSAFYLCTALGFASAVSAEGNLPTCDPTKNFYILGSIVGAGEGLCRSHDPNRGATLSFQRNHITDTSDGEIHATAAWRVVPPGVTNNGLSYTSFLFASADGHFDGADGPNETRLGRPQSCRMVKTSHLKNLTTCREASTPLAFLPMLRGLAAKFIMKCIATLDEYDIDELAREISGETDDDLACKLHEEACIIREVYPSFGYNVQAHLLNIQLKSTTKQSEANVFPRANIVRWFQS